MVDDQKLQKIMKNTIHLIEINYHAKNDIVSCNCKHGIFITGQSDIKYYFYL